MWQLQSEKDNTRIYRNSETNSECILNKCYTDREGNIWWQFNDLMSLPFARTFAASTVTALYAAGLRTEDISNFLTELKTILRSKDNGEKYEQAYGEIIKFERYKFKEATDPVKQMSSLVCVYFTINDEPIDSFSNNIQLQKLGLLEADPQMHSFFLTRQIQLIERSQVFLNQLSPTASQ